MAAVPVPDSVPTLELVNVYAGYGPFRAIFDVSIAIERGSVLALLGSNGAGKTTIARVCSGLIQPTAGAVLLAGLDVTKERPSRYARLGVVHAPEVGTIKPEQTRAIVVLPAPLEPSSASTLPFATVNDTSKMARNGP